MKQITVKGHRRAVTQVKYNREGDLLFTCAKDRTIWVHNAETGEFLGSYDGHSGSVWDVDANHSGTMLASAGADEVCIIWEVTTGKILAKIKHATPVRAVCWAHDGSLLTVQDKSYGKTPCIKVFDVPTTPEEVADHEGSWTPKYEKENPERIVCAIFGEVSNFVYFGTEDGFVVKYDLAEGKEDGFQEVHPGSLVKTLSWDSEYLMLLSAGADQCACLLDPRDLRKIKTYPYEFPVNGAVAVPSDVMDHVIIGGGLDAQSVTNVGGNRNKFPIKIMHKIRADELGQIGGHFGPVNALAAEPNGRGFASGGEDGHIFLNIFDADYYEAPGKPDEDMVQDEPKKKSKAR
eukprot:TRINITY_DN15231_c0_g1_i1.p2 TRINITY_DN15231_c0_g1~~TRINITY_DN15231_c0_g1_i1.p2  ORF type:complete len:348 (+),score=102.21 TRINITY_DN15231_c0_g1_i1:59-1102(+)